MEHKISILKKYEEAIWNIANTYKFRYPILIHAKINSSDHIILLNMRENF